jgi:NADH-quinone oxidoreductase subunit A
VTTASAPTPEKTVFLTYHAVLVFLITGVAMVCTPLVLGALFRPRNDYHGKSIAYECGEDPIGEAQIRFDMRFYTAALIFIVFDVEIAFMFPWAYVFQGFPDRGLALIEGLVFILILFLGLIFVWAKGDVDWVKTFQNKRRVQG